MARESSTIALARKRAKNAGTSTRIHTEADARAVVDGGCWYEPKAAAHVVEFFRDFLRHSKGEWAGRPFTLLPWQRTRLIEPLFGWRRPDETRRFRRGGIWVPKKSGKTTLCSGISLYLLVGDNEPGAEVCSAANDRNQAGFIYRENAAMVRQSPELSSVLECIDSRKTISYAAGNGFYQALSADVPTKEGMNLHGLISDELHAWQVRGLWSTLAYAGAARRQPICPLSISTAGIFDPASIGWEQYTYAKRVLTSDLDDWSFFALVYEADPKADWTIERTWKSANPSYGHTVKIDALREECREAQESPAKQNDFLRYRLNIWVQQNTRAIDLRVWDEAAACEDPEDDARPWCGGLDLGGVSDLSAWVMVARCVRDPEAVDVRCRFWLPEATLQGKHPNVGLYQQWVRSGHLVVTPGNVTEERFIQAQIVADTRAFNFGGGNIDRAFQGARLAIELADEGVVLDPFGQGFLSMAVPTRKFLELVTARRLHHRGHPILRWMADNVVLKNDPAGNNKVDKDKSAQKVDGIVACIMALAKLEAAGVPNEQLMEVWG
jgi:phage terminase large subunit-like protein